eukprot:scaffold69403_cov28-Prasinocladus_malaysianus.AAC.1
MNSTLEEECQHGQVFESKEECVTDPGLPHSQFLTNETQRLVRGYYKSAYVPDDTWRSDNAMP